MSPSIAISPTQEAATADTPVVGKAIFPDGIKTSGQHGPIFSRVRAYQDFPKHITGPTVWKAEDYRDHPERWTHVFSDEEIRELEKSTDDFMTSGAPLTGITKDNFPLPTLSLLSATIRKEILNGKGFILFKGIPVQRWGLEKSAVSLTVQIAFHNQV